MKPFDGFAKPTIVGLRAESRVAEVFEELPAPWEYFPTIEWRHLERQGESVGEADMVVFHPHHGLIVFEIKAGAVHVQDGQWFYASGLQMKQSPFAQARRNRYALIDKLRQRLGRDAADALTVTHAVWFPDVLWKGSLPVNSSPIIIIRATQKKMMSKPVTSTSVG